MLRSTNLCHRVRHRRSKCKRRDELKNAAHAQRGAGSEPGWRRPWRWSWPSREIHDEIEDQAMAMIRITRLNVDIAGLACS